MPVPLAAEAARIKSALDTTNGPVWPALAPDRVTGLLKPAEMVSVPAPVTTLPTVSGVAP